MDEIHPLYPEGEASASNHLRPSLFELLAEEQLRDLLHPVVRYVLSFLAQHHPRYFLRLVNYHEECFAFLLLLVEQHHLKKHNASLSEHFYQLRLVQSAPGRIATPRLETLESWSSRPLSRRQRWGLLVFLVGLPYLRARAQDYFERLGGGRDPDAAGEAEISAPSGIQRVFKAVYPYAALALDVTLVGYDIAYLFERTGWYRPWHSLLGVTVERRDPEEDVPPPSGVLANLPPLLPPLLLLLKLSQWWYSPSSPRTLSSTTTENRQAKNHAAILPPRPLPILPTSGLLPAGSSPPISPPPPYTALDSDDSTSASTGKAALGAVSGYTILKAAYGTCPLCKRKWQNPAILPSGWVMCWRCGWDAIEGGGEAVGEAVGERGEKDRTEVGNGEGGEVREIEIGNGGESGGDTTGQARSWRGRCPITGIPVGPGDLRRVLV